MFDEVFHFVAFGQKGDFLSDPIRREVRRTNRNIQIIKMPDRDNGDLPVEDSQHGDIPPESDRETPPRAVIEAATNTQDEANVNSAEKGK